MENIEWWESLDSDTTEWLIEHNGEAVPTGILTKIVAVGGDVASGAWWVGETDREGFHLSDAAIDWIETVANEESP